MKPSNRMLRSALAVLGIVVALAMGPAAATERPAATLYKNPQCTCCEQYANYLRGNGFTVKVVPTHNLSLIRRQAGIDIPEKLEGCHTMLIDNYVVDGHVPLKTLDRLLTERPEIRGISLPGMPEGSPGMTGQKTEPFTIYEIGNDAEPRVYATE
jgi:hypothetical protein